MITRYETAASTHPLTFDLFYDTNLAQIDYDDWCLENNARRSELSSWFTDHVFYIGEPAPAFTFSELSKLNKAAIVELYDTFNDGYFANGSETKTELIHALLTVDLQEYNEVILREHGWNDFSNHAKSDYITVSGYSQGDTVLVVDTARRGMPTKKMIKAGEDLDSQREYIKNMFYDTPVTFVIDVNDADGFTDTLHPQEYLKDIYYYTKADAEQAVNQCDLSDTEKKLIIDALPNSIEYI